ncbi:RB1-INDUCIBLE COILED-COIL PROTEIN [Salix purpurea]|uniref:RB1-INDUCIBLE COILED-COIL PROTEIN n=1 Tax=Salix purpurea TaxID=77065 RepID=A0A9Q0WX01_SALPP|nr:RB1-INDUCIBLE COILED-COIL PROTEIN [Salix purpurea]
MKRLINEEISQQSSAKKNAPSIVARLMGVDMLPLETKSAVQKIDNKKAITETKISKKEKNERRSAAHLSSNSSSYRQMELDSLYDGKEQDADRWSKGQKLGKPSPREHPQEEELQKFKKEFEAWQTARFKECSKVVEHDCTPGQLRVQENINKKKMALDVDSRIPASERHAEPQGLTSKPRSHERSGLQHPRHKVELFPVEQDFFPARNRIVSRNIEHSMINYDEKQDNSSAHTRIVILKPGPDRICDYDESWTSSSGTFEDRGSIEDFLQEVKERLKCELQGKTHRSSVVRGSGIETPFNERPSDPKQIAQHIAKQVRDSVTRDLGMNLLRSESTRSYRSEIQFD